MLEAKAVRPASPRRSRRGRWGPVRLTGAGWALGLAATAAIVGTPYLMFGYHSPELHVALETVDGCSALLLSFLVYGRFARSRRAQDLLLAEGLFLLAVGGLGLTLLLDAMGGFTRGTLDAWLPMALRVAGALLVAAGALAGDVVLAEQWRRRGRVLPWAVLILLFVVLWLVRGLLPAALDQNPPASAAHPVVSGHPVLVATQVLTALCFLVASVAFAQRAVRRRDELLRWLGPSCALAGFARVNYALFPSLYSGWLYTGDLLRTAAYLLLLVGAAREISQYWSAQARAAVLEDRRRLARELHDGLVQELAYVRLEAAALAAGPASERIVASCDRALDEARAAVDTLGSSPSEPLAFVLHRGARQVAERFGSRVDVELDDSVTADHDVRQALVRITREAVRNAIRHGRAARIRLLLQRGAAGNVLVIEDDGVGFDVTVLPSATGLGLVGMEERARGLGGRLDVRSTPGQGTRVAVTW